MDDIDDAHHQPESKPWLICLLSYWFFPSLRWLLPAIFLAICGAWLINILGESTVLNSSDIYYTYTDPVTGKLLVTKGCPYSRLRSDGTCDKRITFATIKHAFPLWDRHNQTPSTIPMATP